MLALASVAKDSPRDEAVVELVKKALGPAYPGYGYAALFAVAYFVSAELGHFLSFSANFASFWPASGVYLIALLINPTRRWPILVGAGIAANFSSDLLFHGRTIPVSLGFCLANSAEAALGAWLLQRFAGIPFTLSRMRNVLALAASAFLATSVAATIGAATVSFAFGAFYPTVWVTWWTGDAIGVLIAAPLLLTVLSDGATIFSHLRPRQVGEFTGLVAALTLTAVITFSYANLPLAWAVLPFMLWAALRFRVGGVSLATAVLSAITVWCTAHGRGPFAQAPSVNEKVLLVQAYVSVIGFSFLAVAAIVAERREAMLQVQESEERFRQLSQELQLRVGQLQQALSKVKELRGLLPICAWCKKIRDDQEYWHDVETYVAAHTDVRFSHGICPECLEMGMQEMQEIDRTK